jgi:hypothetical protein
MRVALGRGCAVDAKLTFTSKILVRPIPDGTIHSLAVRAGGAAAAQ